MDREKSSPGQVGDALQAARMARGESLDCVCQHTRIPKRFLEALENGRPDELPAPVYWRSFLQDYCEYLEMPFEPLWEALKPEPLKTPPTPASADQAPDENAEAPQPVSWEKSPYLQALASSSGALLAALALAAALIVWIAHEHGAKTPPEDFHPSALRPLRATVEPTLVVTFKDEAWISLKADDLTLCEGRAPKNTRQEWRAQKAFQLRTYAPENMDITLNGAPVNLSKADADGSYRIGPP